MSIDVSVIVPVYNTEKYLNDCIDSIVTQTIIERIEIILVNDGSTDDSPKICDSFALKYKNITVIHQENAGVSAARNVGIEKASGKYIGFVDSDDYIFPRMYEMLLKNAENTNADMSVCGFVHCLLDKEVFVHYPFLENKALDKQYIRERLYVFLLEGESFNSCCNKLFRRLTTINSSILFETGRKIGEDRRFVIEFLAKCGVACYTSYLGYYYRLVSTSAIQAPRKNYMENYIAQHYEDYELFKVLGVDLAVIEERSGLKLLEQAIVGIYFAENKLKGQERRTVIKAITYNREMCNHLYKNWEILMTEETRYKKLLFFMIRTKSVFGLRMVMLTMKTKNSLMRFKAL